MKKIMIISIGKEKAFSKSLFCDIFFEKNFNEV